MNREDASPPTDRTKPWLWIAAGVLLGLGVGLAAVGLFASGRIWPRRLDSTKIAPAVPQVNAPALNFTLQTLDGRALSLADLKGKTVLLNFWATWCGPCRAEMPLLQQAQDRNPDRLVILALNNGEAPDLVNAFVSELGLRLAVLLDPDNQVTERYRVRGFPTTIFIDTAGVIRYQHIGVLNQGTLAGYLTDLGLDP